MQNFLRAVPTRERVGRFGVACKLSLIQREWNDFSGMQGGEWMGVKARRVRKLYGRHWLLDGDHVINLLANGKQWKAFQRRWHDQRYVFEELNPEVVCDLEGIETGSKIICELERVLADQTVQFYTPDVWNGPVDSLKRPLPNPTLRIIPVLEGGWIDTCVLFQETKWPTVVSISRQHMDLTCLYIKVLSC